jgi:hypothetical protein
VPAGVQPGQSFKVQVPSAQQPTLAVTGSPEQVLAASLAAAGGGIHLVPAGVQPKQQPGAETTWDYAILNAAGAPIATIRVGTTDRVSRPCRQTITLPDGSLVAKLEALPRPGCLGEDYEIFGSAGEIFGDTVAQTTTAWTDICTGKEPTLKLSKTRRGGQPILTFESSGNFLLLPFVLATFCLGACCLTCCCPKPDYRILKGGDVVGSLTARVTCCGGGARNSGGGGLPIRSMAFIKCSDPVVLRGALNLLAAGWCDPNAANRNPSA